MWAGHVADARVGGSVADWCTERRAGGQEGGRVGGHAGLYVSRTGAQQVGARTGEHRVKQARCYMSRDVGRRVSGQGVVRSSGEGGWASA